MLFIWLIGRRGWRVTLSSLRASGQWGKKWPEGGERWAEAGVLPLVETARGCLGAALEPVGRPGAAG